MTARRLAASLAVAAIAGSVAALPAAAKEGVTATLEDAIPFDAPAGSNVTVRWSLAARDEDGARRPFSAAAVFVRLLSETGAGAKVGFASSNAHAAGKYAATVVVPDGGIRDVQIGLRGFTSGATGTHNADVLFPIANDPRPGLARVVRPASATDWTPWIARALLACAIVSAAAVGVTFVRRHPRSVASGG
jgi:hypothetical protein